MTSINSKGQLVCHANNGREIPIHGLIFFENIYLMKLLHITDTGEKLDKDTVIDQTIKFSLI